MQRTHAKAGLTAVIAVGLATGLLAHAAKAQDYPNKPVTMVIPFAAGGPTDVVARIVGERMARSLGQPVVIENVAGAGGTTGSNRTAAAAPDGYTLMIGHTGTHAAAPALYPKLKYDPANDFTPIGVVNTNAIYIATRKTLPPNTLKELVDYLKANEKVVTNAHAGIGSVSHTTCLLFNSLLGIKPQTVPYRGTGPAMNDLVGGQVDYLCDQVVNVAPQAKAGAIKALAVAQDARNQALPDVPTTTEAGLPAYKVVVWNIMLGPKGLPDAVTAKVNAALKEALADPGVKARLTELGADLPAPDLLTSAGAKAFIQAEVAKWTPVIKNAGVTAE